MRCGCSRSLVASSQRGAPSLAELHPIRLAMTAFPASSRPKRILPMREAGILPQCSRKAAQTPSVQTSIGLLMANPPGCLDLPRFRGELRAWDQSSCWGVIRSSSFVAFFGSAPRGAILPSRPAYSAAVARSGGQGRPILGPPGGRVLDGREHDGRLVCVGSDLQTLIPALIVDR